VTAMLGAAAVTMAFGCATLASSKADDQLFVESTPSGAFIFVNDVFAGSTPRLVPMPRDHVIKVRCSLAGHWDNTATVFREAASATSFDSPALALVDELTGAAYPLQRRTLRLDLAPLARATATSAR
jgi:hypothetical protein